MDRNLKVLVPLILIIGVAAGVSLRFHPNLLTATLLFWGLSAAYLSFLNQKLIVRTLVFSLLAVLTFGLTMDYLGVRGGLWNTTSSVFSWRLFGNVPFENPLWAFFYSYVVVMVYESLAATPKKQFIKKRFFVLIGCLAMVEAAIHWSPFGLTDKIVGVPHLYLLLGTTLFLVPLLVFLIKFTSYLPKFFITACYIFPMAFLNEITSLRNSHWIFPTATSFIGRWHLLGVSVPFEELFFFMIIGAPAILTYYVYFFRGDN